MWKLKQAAITKGESFPLLCSCTFSGTNSSAAASPAAEVPVNRVRSRTRRNLVCEKGQNIHHLHDYPGAWGEGWASMKEVEYGALACFVDRIQTQTAIFCQKVPRASRRIITGKGPRNYYHIFVWQSSAETGINTQFGFYRTIFIPFLHPHGI